MLMITMIVGVITVVGLLVTRMPNVNAMAPALPEQLQMPAGAKATAVTMGAGWIGVVTTDNRILIYSRESGALMQDIKVNALSAGQ